MTERNQVVLFALLPAMALLFAWQAWTSTFPEHEFFLGSPGGIWREAVAMADTGKLGRAFVVTLMEAVAGFAAGTLLGSATGLLVWLSPAIQRAARYHLAILGSIPLFALGPVFVFWLGTGMSSKIVLSFIACFIVCAAQASAGTAEVSRGLLQLGQLYGLTRRELLRQIVAPAAFVWVLAGLRLSGGMAILGAVVGEFIAAREGLGHLIVVAEGLYNVNQIWVGIAGVSLVGLILLAVATPIERRALVWKATSH